ncbi:MAG: response regulator [Devosia sp.]
MSPLETPPVYSGVVLVVEDDVLIRLGIVDELRDFGFTVFAAGDADAAIVLLETHSSINLLFTDIEMPGSMDGLGLAAAVCKRWPEVRIIVTSGQFTIFDRDLPEGRRFFPKPYLGTEIAAALGDMRQGCKD